MPLVCGVPRCEKPMHRMERCELHYYHYLAQTNRITTEQWRKYQRMVDPFMDQIYQRLGEKMYDDSPPTNYLYAIRSDAEPPVVKIGISNCPDGRLATLQTASPFELDLMGRVEGSYKLERAIHAILEDYRLRGEWFRYEGEAKKIADAIATGSLDAIEACFEEAA